MKCGWINFRSESLVKIFQQCLYHPRIRRLFLTNAVAAMSHCSFCWRKYNQNNLESNDIIFMFLLLFQIDSKYAKGHILVLFVWFILTCQHMILIEKQKLLAKEFADLVYLWSTDVLIMPFSFTSYTVNTLKSCKFKNRIILN